MKRTITKDDRVYVECDLYLAGLTEDGEEYQAESYYVVIERLDGHRSAHNTCFNGCIRHENVDNGFIGFQDIRKEAKKQANILVSRIIDRGEIETDRWIEITPSYGSDYYCVCNNIR